MDMNSTDVSEAFQILLEQIEAMVSALNEHGAEVLRKGDYGKARAVIDQATRITEFREKVKGLQREWVDLAGPPASPRQAGSSGSNARLRRGMRTPEEAFRRPILEALLELGGRGRVQEVLDIVERKMKGILNSHDYEALPSGPNVIRWRNTAQWCRASLVQEGLLKAGSPYGVWEISEQGRQWLSLQQEVH